MLEAFKTLFVFLYTKSRSLNNNNFIEQNKLESKDKKNKKDKDKAILEEKKNDKAKKEKEQNLTLRAVVIQNQNDLANSKCNDSRIAALEKLTAKCNPVNSIFNGMTSETNDNQLFRQGMKESRYNGITGYMRES